MKSQQGMAVLSARTAAGMRAGAEFVTLASGIFSLIVLAETARTLLCVKQALPDWVGVGVVTAAPETLE
jgi:hypothetical protein